MRIGYITPEFLPNWGGIGTYSIELARNIPSNIEFHVFTLNKEGAPTPPTGFGELFGKNIIYHSLGKATDPFMSNARMQMIIGRKMKSLIKEHDLDIIHSNHALMSDLLFKFRRSKTPSVTTVHTTITSQSEGTRDAAVDKSLLEPSEKKTGLLLPVLRQAERSYFKRTRNIICVSRFIQEMVRRRWDHFDINDVVNNGIDIEAFSPGRPEGERFEALTQKGGPVVLFSGRLLAMKGIYTFLDAAKALQDRGTKVHFAIAGAGDQSGTRKKIADLGIHTDDISILDQVSYHEMPHLYRACDIYTVPSYTESFPMCVLEAMGCAKPIVASSVGGIPEIIEDGKTGRLVPAGNADAMATSVQQLLDDPSGSKKMAKAAREVAESKYSSRIMTSNTIEFYQKVLEGTQ